MATRNSNPNSKRVFRERNNQKSEKIPSKDRKIKIEIRLSNRFGKTLSDTHLKIDQQLKKKTCNNSNKQNYFGNICRSQQVGEVA